MKKSLVFSLLLLAVAVIAMGCGSNSDWTPPNATQPAVTLTGPTTPFDVVAGGDPQTVNITCTNSGVDRVSNPAGPTLAKVGEGCDFSFTTTTPGIYVVTLTAIRDHSKTVTVTFNVAPDLAIGGRANINASNATQQFTAAGTGTSASLDAGSTPTWSFANNAGDDIGSIDATGLFTLTGDLGKGTVTLKLDDVLTGKEYTATLAIEVGEGGSASGKPPELEDFGPFNGVGLWGDRPQPNNFDYDPSLDDFTIPDNAFVYSVFEMDAAYNITPLPLPTAIDGYTKVTITGDDFSELKAGQWAEVELATYSYLAIIPKFQPPSEIEDLGVFNGVGLWGDRPQPNTFNYDPSLDDFTIPDNAYVFSVFEMDAAYNITPLPLPTAISGYTKVTITGDDFSALKAGQWAEIELATYSYLAIVPYDFVP